MFVVFDAINSLREATGKETKIRLTVSLVSSVASGTGSRAGLKTIGNGATAGLSASEPYDVDFLYFVLFPRNLIRNFHPISFFTNLCIRFS